MATITTINGTDKIKDSRAVINTNFANLNNDKVETLSDLGVTATASAVNTAVTNSPTTAEKAALAGGGSFGTPSGVNKFLTEQFINTLGFTYSAPTVVSTASNTVASGTSHAVTLPGSISVGNLLIVAIATTGTAGAPDVAGFTSGWSEAANNGTTLHVLTKIATGSDALTITTGNIVESVIHTYNISNFWNAAQSKYLIVGANSNSTTPGRTNLNEFKEHLFLTFYAWQNTGTITTPPTGFTDAINLNGVAAGSSRSNMISARSTPGKVANLQPGAWTGGSGTRDGNVTITLAILRSPQNTD